MKFICMVPIRFLCSYSEFRFLYGSYVPIANLDSYTLPIRKKTIFDEFLYGRLFTIIHERTKYET